MEGVRQLGRVCPVALGRAGLEYGTADGGSGGTAGACGADSMESGHNGVAAAAAAAAETAAAAAAAARLHPAGARQWQTATMTLVASSAVDWLGRTLRTRVTGSCRPLWRKWARGPHGRGRWAASGCGAGGNTAAKRAGSARAHGRRALCCVVAARWRATTTCHAVLRAPFSSIMLRGSEKQPAYGGRGLLVSPSGGGLGCDVGQPRRCSTVQSGLEGCGDHWDAGET